MEPLGLDFVLGLRPIVYKFRDYYSNITEIEDGPDGEQIQVERTIEHRFTRPHEGFLAQELEALVKSLGREDSAIFTKDEQTGRYGLRYEEIVSPLVRAIQQQQAQIEVLTARISALE